MKLYTAAVRKSSSCSISPFSTDASWTSSLPFWSMSLHTFDKISLRAATSDSSSFLVSPAPASVDPSATWPWSADAPWLARGSAGAFSCCALGSFTVRTTPRRLWSRPSMLSVARKTRQLSRRGGYRCRERLNRSSFSVSSIRLSSSSSSAASMRSICVSRIWIPSSVREFCPMSLMRFARWSTSRRVCPTRKAATITFTSDSTMQTSSCRSSTVTRSFSCIRSTKFIIWFLYSIVSRSSESWDVFCAADAFPDAAAWATLCATSSSTS
mmetsp:Transcript_16746/g.63672  ORF Transcript_16746/g.63672 Transcript_16746/m.63672 type:complete len:269 (+) Transcript_16746:1725-2531(+)